jgi:hemin uptake protein HemP
MRINRINEVHFHQRFVAVMRRSTEPEWVHVMHAIRSVLRRIAMQTVSNSRPLLRAPQRHAVAPSPDEAVVEASEPGAADERLSIDSVSLLRGGKCVQIAHNGAMYKLQATKLGKLILTK